MKTRMIKDYKYTDSQFIRRNTVMIGRRLPTGIFSSVFQCIEGQYSGVKVPDEYFVEVPQGKMYTEDEHRSAIQRLAGQIEAERNEKLLLLQQIERSVEEQRKDFIVIPLEVAEAIIWFRQQELNNEDIYDLSYEEDDGKYASILYNWVEGEGDRDALMKALVNGYTVEQTLQQRINEGVAQLARVWIHDTKILNEATTIEFASKVARFVQEVHAE